jgi:hypothetical protein
MTQSGPEHQVTHHTTAKCKSFSHTMDSVIQWNVHLATTVQLQDIGFGSGVSKGGAKAQAADCSFATPSESAISPVLMIMPRYVQM